MSKILEVGHDDEDGMEILPSIYRRTYSTCKRPRRQNNGIPTRFHNTFLRCVEYPNGVYIDRKGVVRPDVKMVSSETIDDDDWLSDNEFESLPDTKRRDMVKKLKLQQAIEEREELETLQDYKMAMKEDYELSSDFVVTKDFVDYMKGDKDYIPSDESDSDLTSSSSSDDENEAVNDGDETEYDDEEDCEGDEGDPDDDDEEVEGDDDDDGDTIEA